VKLLHDMHDTSSTWGPYFAALPEEGLLSKYTFPESYARMLQSGVEVSRRSQCLPPAAVQLTHLVLGLLHVTSMCIPARACRKHAPSLLGCSTTTYAGHRMAALHL
jgi:hypothetical protein